MILQAVGVALALAVAAAGVQTWRLRSAALDMAELQSSIQTERSAAADTAREWERDASRRVTEAQRARETELAAGRAVAAAAGRERERLRDEIAAYALGAPGDTAAASNQRAAELGGLLESALRTSEECARSAEIVAADARAMRDAVKR
jgi:hypothetical protein